MSANDLFMFQATLEGVAGSVTGLVVPVLLGVAMVVGLLMWLLGRRLARPAIAISGVVLGGLGGLARGRCCAIRGRL